MSLVDSVFFSGISFPYPPVHPQSYTNMDGEVPEPTLLVKLMHPAARPPARQSPGAAGYDLHACEGARVEPGSWACVDTGIGVAVPEGTYGRIAPRSGLSAKGVDIGAGVVDADYRGRLKVLLFNHAAAPLDVSPGDRVAQLILERILTPPVRVLGPAEDLGETRRGAGGFGSTGK